MRSGCPPMLFLHNSHPDTIDPPVIHCLWIIESGDKVIDNLGNRLRFSCPDNTYRGYENG